MGPRDKHQLDKRSKYNLSKQGIKNADVHNVGNGINAQDALAIQSYVISRIDTLPVGERVYQTMYPAKDATISGGITETVNAGYTEDCYVNLNNEIGSNITFNVEAGQTGNYYVAIRNANASTNDRKMKIEVNGASEYWVQSFLPTGDWTTWVETGIVLPLVAGMNTIKMTSLMSEGAPNLDYLRIELTDEPIAETYDPSSENITPTGNSTIYIAGDSTVQSYRESYKPQQGWGYYLQNYLNDVTVSNQAIAGRSSKSFVDNGRLDTILNTIKEGDYLMVQFAINDADYTKTERYAPVCGKVQNPDNGSFEYYIAKYSTDNMTYGYNIESGGRSNMVVSDETRQKLSLALKGRVFSDEHKEHIGKSLLGRTYSNETREKMRQAKLGKYDGKCHPQCRPVYCPELNQTFWGAKEAEELYGIDKTYITACLRGRQKSAGKHPITGEKLHWMDANAFTNCIKS